MQPSIWRKIKWVVLWSAWAAHQVRQPTPLLLVSNGWMRGSVDPAGTHVSYLGIPYATVIKRFQAPGPEPIWQGIYEAIDGNIACTQQVGIDTSLIIGQEDCLVLNVYTPLHIPQNYLLPVMVFIHGGSYMQLSSSPSLFGPDFLTSKDVILVTINYRLYVLGFLCLGIKQAPGNAGMKDQVAALKWIRRNIKVFGGDPENVTIFGQSAGASSVSYHVASPMSKGLFHKAIIQSGSSISSFANQDNPIHLAATLAKHMGFHSEDPHELYKFFDTIDDKQLAASQIPQEEGNVMKSRVLFVPCLENVINGVEPFITETTYDILSRGDFHKVPMIIGANNEESLLFVALETEESLSKVTFNKSLTRDLVFISEAERLEVADKVQKMYMGDETNWNENKYKFSKIYCEPEINYPAVKETEIIVKNSKEPVYHYLFSYDGWRNVFKLLLPDYLRSVPGATHADDVSYILSQSIPSVFERRMVNVMTTMWTNFAKCGDPTPEGWPYLKWFPITTEDKRALLIDEELSYIPLWHSESMKVWDDIYTKHRKGTMLYFGQNASFSYR